MESDGACNQDELPLTFQQPRRPSHQHSHEAVHEGIVRLSLRQSLLQRLCRRGVLPLRKPDLVFYPVPSTTKGEVNGAKDLLVTLAEH